MTFSQAGPGVKTVTAGDVVAYETKSALTTFRGWGQLVSLAGAVLIVLVATGVVEQDAADRINARLSDPALAGAVTLIVGAAMQAYGGWRARRPLSIAGGTLTDPAKVN